MAEKTIKIKICDFCKDEVQAVDIVRPSKRDVCAKHREEFMRSIKYENEITHYKIAVDPEEADPVFTVKLSK